MHSQRLAIRFGGIGVMVPTAGAGIMVGDGIGLIMLGGILRGIGAAGMVATGVAGMAADIGDIITIGMVVLAGAGAVETIGHEILIIIIVVLILVLVEEVHVVLLMQQVEIVGLVQPWGRVGLVMVMLVSLLVEVVQLERITPQGE